MADLLYESVFKKEFRDLVELKQALGFSYETEASGFKRIDRFFISIGLAEKTLTKETCEAWCRKRSYETTANQAGRVSMMRVFCSYLNDIGIPAYIPAKGIAGKIEKYPAHIFTDDELRRFFSAVDASQSVPSECPYRSMIMPVFFRILYTSGMRVSELRLARISDVNLDENYIIVRNGKNHKDRIVPIHPDLSVRCREIKDAVHISSPDSEYFFLLRPGRAMTLQNVYKNFRRYLDKAGITHTGRGPRVHDFRHTYSVNLLRKWTDEGKDLMVYIPYMRTMLGHESFEETAYYLKLTAERFPYIKKRLKESFPDLLKEVAFDDREFY